MTTASVRKEAPTPLGEVRVPTVNSDHTGYQTNQVSNPYPDGRQSLNQYSANRNMRSQRSGVVRQALPAPTQNSVAPAKVDPIATGSVKTVENTVSAAKPRVGGWSPAGGTSVTLRQGETVYNLSKRYGVPVAAIVKANSLKSADAVQAGQRIIIPTYVYSSAAPISAPDNNPKTRAARASRGLVGQADPARVPSPQKRPLQSAALKQPPVEETVQGLKPRYKPKPSVKDESDTQVPDYSIVTGSVEKQGSVPLDGLYVVRSGDTLSRIALRSGISTGDLMRANGLENSNIRVGQKLQIPKAGTIVKTAKANVSAATETTVKKLAPKEYTKPTVDSTVTNSVDTKAPGKTGIDNLRWPVRGRIVSGFGGARNGGKNDGIDISVPEGTSVRSAENGVVIYSGNELEEFGNLVLIRHSDGIVTAYAHNKSNLVSKGDNVTRGQVIAKSGRTGKTDTPVLHFEVRKNSTPVNPVKYLGG